jgi:hypothetical protein
LGIPNPNHTRQEAAEMSVEHLTDICNPTSTSEHENHTPEQVLQKLVQLSNELQQLVVNAVNEGSSFDDTERATWSIVQRTGFEAMKLFIVLQGNGDLGETTVTNEGKTLHCSSDPAETVVRSIFGTHSFEQYTYSPGKNKAIELQPISARMQLPEHRWSYLLQEFSQIFCVESAFKQGGNNLGTVLGTTFPTDTLEQTNQRMGMQAEAFLDQLPIPEKKDEGELLVASADCKGVPLIKEKTTKVAAFETSKKRPGNRRMATVTSAYTVDPHVRTGEQIVSALFRDEKKPEVELEPKKKRPQPKNKHTSAHFPTTVFDCDKEIPISGIHEGMAWLADQIMSRRTNEQMLVFLMDGQESLWNIAEMYFEGDEQFVPILDIIHVSTYVWEASSLFEDSREQRAVFTRKRLLRILRGEVVGVIRGLRRMGTIRKLKGDKLKDLKRICGYFEKHEDRMRYDEYLAAGYPIASGVIEGACGHLVKDRMERSGMRWTLEGARSMLNVRAVFQSDYWHEFCQQRVVHLSHLTHPNRYLITDYSPLTLTC